MFFFYSFQGDHVYVRPEGQEQYIARIDKMWEDSTYVQS